MGQRVLKKSHTKSLSSDLTRAWEMKLNVVRQGAELGSIAHIGREIPPAVYLLTFANEQTPHKG